MNNHSRARRGLALTTGALALALTLTACGSGTDSSDAGNESFTVAVAALPESLDPQVIVSGVNVPYTVWSSTLIARSIADDGTVDLTGELAESWSVEDDGSIRIHLKDATSSYGNHLTSDDVVWSFERMLALDPSTTFMLGISGFDVEDIVTVIDDKNLTLNAKSQNVLSEAALSVYTTTILDSTEAKKHATADDEWASKWLAQNTATFGAYNVTEFSPGEDVRAEANPDWFGGDPGFDEVVIKAVPEASTRKQLVESGDVDYAAGILRADMAAVEANDDLAVHTADLTSTDMIALNYEFEPFKSAKVRRALAMALDRDAIVEGAYQGMAKPAEYQVPESSWTAMVPGGISGAYGYDVAQAKALLAEAGYAHGFEFELAVNDNRPGPQAATAAILVKQQLADIGVDVTINQVASAADFSEGKKGKFTAWIDHNNALLPDPGYAAWVAAGNGNILMSGADAVASKKVAELTPQLFGAGEARTKVLTQYLQTLQDDTLLLPFAEKNEITVLRSDITGWENNPENETVHPALLGRR